MDGSIAALLGVAEGASFWTNFLAVVWRVFIVLLGVNMLVIVHEWGHFIVARMCGVRCDKFYIWFDAYGFKLFSFKRGDTEYGLGWLPLGGYVKMLGQEDNPGGIQAEIERAKAERDANPSETNDEQKKTQDERIASLENQLYAPDSYLAKNVFQRMAIISAGVVMNVIFAIICASCAALMGTPETSAKIGYVAPGSPAWQAGLQGGDEIVRIGENDKPIFSSILVACMDGKELDFGVRKAGVGEPISIKITPRHDKGALTPMIGVGPSPSLALAETEDSRPFDASLDSAECAALEANLGALKGNELLVSMNGVPVKSPADYLRLSRLYVDRPIEYVFAPTLPNAASDPKIDESKEQIKVTLAPSRAPDVGVRLTMGEIVAIMPGSVAEKAGLRARQVDENGEVVQRGDVIVSVDERPTLDPLTFPYEIFARTSKEIFASSSEKVSDAPTEDDSTKGASSSSILLTVNREGESLDFSIVLPRAASYTGFASSQGNLACGSLGIAYEVKPVVSGIDGTVDSEKNAIGNRIVEFEAQVPSPGADASPSVQELFKGLTGRKAADVPAGELVAAKTSTVGKDENSETEIAASVLNWFNSVLPYLPNGTPVVVTTENADGERIKLETKVKRDCEAFLVDRGLLFGVDSVFQRADSLGAALSFGVAKTYEAGSQVFVFLKNVGKNVSAKALGGPGMIVGTAYQAAGRKDGVFLLFLCLISANLAVVNFLPIPVLDGGHMVFLLYEAITRRKPNEKVQIGLSYVGFALILALMFWVIFLDVVRYCF